MDWEDIKEELIRPWRPIKNKWIHIAALSIAIPLTYVNHCEHNYFQDLKRFSEGQISVEPVASHYFPMGMEKLFQEELEFRRKKILGLDEM